MKSRSELAQGFARIADEIANQFAREWNIERRLKSHKLIEHDRLPDHQLLQLRYDEMVSAFTEAVEVMRSPAKNPTAILVAFEKAVERQDQFYETYHSAVNHAIAANSKR